MPDKPKPCPSCAGIIPTHQSRKEMVVDDKPKLEPQPRMAGKVPWCVNTCQCYEYTDPDFHDRCRTLGTSRLGGETCEPYIRQMAEKIERLERQLATARSMIADLIAGEPDVDGNVLRDALKFADGGDAVCTACTELERQLAEAKEKYRREGLEEAAKWHCDKARELAKEAQRESREKKRVCLVRYAERHYQYAYELRRLAAQDQPEPEPQPGVDYKCQCCQESSILGICSDGCGCSSLPTWEEYRQGKRATQDEQEPEVIALAPVERLTVQANVTVQDGKIPIILPEDGEEDEQGGEKEKGE